MFNAKGETLGLFDINKNSEEKIFLGKWPFWVPYK